jgi:hypothetical protein
MWLPDTIKMVLNMLNYKTKERRRNNGSNPKQLKMVYRKKAKWENLKSMMRKNSTKPKILRSKRADSMKEIKSIINMRKNIKKGSRINIHRILKLYMLLKTIAKILSNVWFREIKLLPQEISFQGIKLRTLLGQKWSTGWLKFFVVINVRIRHFS